MNQPIGPTPDADRDLRHLAEDEQLRIKHQLQVAKARTAEEWFDIFHEIAMKGFRQEIERNGIPIERFDVVMREQRPFNAKVRSNLQSHGLPLTEDIEFEGPDVRKDAAGLPGIVEWPRGMWITLHWPSSPKDDLRFEGQCALIALSFLLWWANFKSVAQHMEGKVQATSSRIVAPGTSEYVDYVTQKAQAKGELPP